ncbi:MAG TPA: hypothetical protein VEV42_03365 [Pyrinomonadaceae bacterium]|nr:hypothetical protein [Pyrinomonadaceae bacterium]
MPQPSCPGCLRPAAADLHEHTCDELKVSFITGLNSCPVCDERLDVAPAFPSPVAQYLKRTRSANKINVTFDYETGSFMPVEDGEFVVVTNVDQNAIVLPRTAKFSAKRDFYEFYQDYYHCSNPDAGEVRIIEPAIVTRAGNGWTLKATGLLEVIAEEPKKPAPVVAEQKAQPDSRACPGCGSMIESRYSFCWKCGHALDQPGNSETTNTRKTNLMMSAAPLDVEDDELTVQHDTPPLSSKMFSWTTGRTSEYHAPGKGSVLKLMGIGAIAFALLSLGLFGLLRSDTPTATATVTQPTTQTAPQPAPSVTFTTEVSRSNPTETTTQQVAGPEDELKKLREKRLNANASERPKIFQALAKIEKQYPRDYRFPYERAKLVVKGSKTNSRAAFKALNVAAEKAISAGKASEMLSGLETDKSGDFSRLSQGNNEWGRLVAALKRKDPSLLSE